MKLQIIQENFSKAVSIASRFASSKAQLPILSNILLSAKSSKLNISSTNLEISVSIETGAKIEEKGEVSVPARVIGELVTNLPKETITLESDKEQLKITSSGFSSKLLGMESSDFPKVPSLVDEIKALKIPKEDLLSALSQVVFATSTDESRPVLTGVLFIWGKNELTLVATDGFRLSQKKIGVHGAKNQPQVILPRLVLSEVSRLESGDEILFYEDQKEKQAIFKVGSVVLSSRLLEGEYPDFVKIIPKESTVNCLVDSEELLRAIKLSSVFARESANIVKFTLWADSIKISAESSSAGSQETKVDAKIEGKGGGFEIAFNYRFVEEFLNSAGEGEIGMAFTTPDKAGVFTVSSDQNYLHLIMPVKIQP